MESQVEWATHKFSATVRGHETTHEIRLPLEVTEKDIDSVKSGLETLLHKKKGKY